MMIMPHVHSNISMNAKLGVLNSQFYKFLKLCSCKSLPNCQSSCHSKGKRLPFKSASKENWKVGSLKKNLVWNFCF
jgi:hypothetical protein